MALRTRIFLFNLLSVLLATLVVSVVILKLAEEAVINHTHENLTQVLLNKTNQIENYFRNLEKALHFITHDNRIQELIRNPNSRRSKEFGHTLSNHVLDYSIHNLMILDSNGKISYSSLPISKATPNASVLTELYRWGMDASENMTMFLDFDNPLYPSSRETAYLASPILKNKKILGIAITEISKKQIVKIVDNNFAWSNSNLESTGETLIYGSNWSLRNERKFKLLRSDNSELKKVENLSEFQDIGTDYRNEKVIRNIGKVYLPNNHYWYILTKVDKNEALHVLYRMAFTSGIAAIIIFLCFFIFTFYTTGKIFKPIRILADRFEKLGRENYTEKIDYSYKDELGLLVSKYNELAGRLESTMVSKDFLDSVIQSIKSLVFIVKINPQEVEQSIYRIVQANESAQKVLDFTQEQIIQINLKSLIQGPPEFKNPNWLIETRHSIEAEIVGRNGQKTPIIVNWNVLPKENESDVTLVFVCTDITERINSERAIIEAREAAINASHAKSEFLARMSHEIRTPLNSIIGITDILAESELRSEQRQLVQVCANASENLLALINDILDISKIEAREVKLENIAFDLITTTENIIDILKPKAMQKNLQLNLNIYFDTNHEIIGDPTRLRQILLNLIGNAIKFTNKGEVNVTLEFLNNHQKFIRFKIQDTGLGVSQEKHHLLFNRFFQADNTITRKFGGSGLGLTICKNLIELMNGEIWFESVEGSGSTFYFTLPYAPAEKPSRLTHTHIHSSNNRPMSLGGIIERNARILIVDDTEDNRFLLLSYLKKYSFDIVQAENGHEAVNKVFKDNFDLILMDIQMPIMDGYAATQIIRRWEADNGRSPIPIIAVSANAMADDIEKSLQAGCTEHATKPLKKTVLMDLIQKYTNEMVMQP